MKVNEATKDVKLRLDDGFRGYLMNALVAGGGGIFQRYSGSSSRGTEMWVVGPAAIRNP